MFVIETNKQKIVLSKLTFMAVMMVVVATTINAQEPDIKDTSKVHYLRGKLINAEGQPLVYAHVINLKRGYATITDSIGQFRLPVIVKDTLRFSSIGYFSKYIQVKEEYFDTLKSFILRKREYDLPTVNIYELRWQVFKSEFMEEEVEEDVTSKNISNWMSNLVSAEELRLLHQAGRGVGFSINFKGKTEKQRRKVAAMEKKYQLIAPKFNDKLITALTGLKGKEIHKFLRFCNFQENFLIHASEYEIMEEIMMFWEAYQKKGLKEGGK